MALSSLRTSLRHSRSAVLRSILWMTACTIRLLILCEYFFLAACFAKEPPKPPKPAKNEWPGF